MATQVLHSIVNTRRKRSQFHCWVRRLVAINNMLTSSSWVLTFQLLNFPIIWYFVEQHRRHVLMIIIVQSSKSAPYGEHGVVPSLFKILYSPYRPPLAAPINRRAHSFATTDGEGRPHALKVATPLAWPQSANREIQARMGQTDGWSTLVRNAWWEGSHNNRYSVCMTYVMAQQKNVAYHHSEGSQRDTRRQANTSQSDRRARTDPQPRTIIVRRTNIPATTRSTTTRSTSTTTSSTTTRSTTT